jgi:large subunit ribosomal protein L21
MYAVIKTGGKQHRVKVGDVIKVERLAGDVGADIVFDSVLMIGGDDVMLGAPTIGGATVRGKVVEQGRGPKIIVKTYKRRQNSNRKCRGHRQSVTSVKIEAIEA